MAAGLKAPKPFSQGDLVESEEEDENIDGRQPVQKEPEQKTKPGKKKKKKKMKKMKQPKAANADEAGVEEQNCCKQKAQFELGCWLNIVESCLLHAALLGLNS